MSQSIWLPRPPRYTDPEFAAEMRALWAKHIDRSGVTGHGCVVDEDGQPAPLNERWAYLNSTTRAGVPQSTLRPTIKEGRN